METEGTFGPETAAAARERYAALAPTARATVGAVAKAMGFDRESYSERVTDEVVAAARDAIFAGLLAVDVGSAEEFEAWCADRPDVDVEVEGSEHVAGVAWHHAPFADRAVAATFENEREAAVATVRRIAFGRLYRDVLADDVEGTDAVAADDGVEGAGDP